MIFLFIPCVLVILLVMKPQSRLFKLGKLIRRSIKMCSFRYNETVRNLVSELPVCGGCCICGRLSNPNKKNQDMPKNLTQLFNVDLRDLAAGMKEDGEREYERYGMRETKDRLTTQEFFNLIESYYSLVNNSQKPKWFFRNSTAQSKFRDMKKLKKNQNADHILSTALFRTIIETFAPDLGLTYDYWASIKTAVNQCWNFQTLTKENNNKKSKVEVALIELLKEENFDEIQQNNETMELSKLLHKCVEEALKKGKHLFAQSAGVRGAMDSFFQAVGLSPMTWESKIRRVSCTCGVCGYTRSSSSRWRMKYYVFYQKQEKPEEIASMFEQVCLDKIAKDVYGTKAQEILDLCVKNKITNLHGMYAEVQKQDSVVFQTNRTLLETSLNNRMLKVIRTALKRKRKPETLKTGAMEIVQDDFSYLIPAKLFVFLKEKIEEYEQLGVMEDDEGKDEEDGDETDSDETEKWKTAFRKGLDDFRF